MSQRKIDDNLHTANLIFHVVSGALAAYVAWRIVVGPDGTKTAKMAAVRYAARLAKSQGERLTNLGSKLDSTYWKIAA